MPSVGDGQFGSTAEKRTFFMTDAELMRLAAKAREKSYSPYSGFSVGAALLGASGKVYSGCNIENASYSPTICAERTAFAKAISEGETSFSAIAIVGGKGEELRVCAPCGVCRQVMREFCRDDFVLLLGVPDNFRRYMLAQLLPLSFGAADLQFGEEKTT